MVADADAFPPLLPVIPEYASWVDNVRDAVARDAATADAAFAGRRGALSGARPNPPATPEHPLGSVADETA